MNTPPRIVANPERNDVPGQGEPSLVSSQPLVIRNERVLRSRDNMVHLACCVAALGAILGLGVCWIRDSWTGSAIPTTAMVTLVLAGICTVWMGQFFSLRRMERPLPATPSIARRVAAVTTFVGSKEPAAMLEHTLVAMVAMRGAHDTWVLDEEDVAEVRALCERLGVHHFSRRGMSEYQTDSGPLRSLTKHGNYNAWFAHIGYERYDVVAMFDPDHVPSAEYLQQTLGYFDAPDVAFVQPPQVYYNQAQSFVARASAEESYGYYSTKLMATYAMGHAVVIGSHGVHRLAALRQMGGMPAHDAEDL